ncbi:MAG TPA: hypothetical protein VM582_07555 [Candidatus Thermoplasmatota archaeon]|nr:hypothetical protein [Candidatus Thermoplasmatota archaeon]
MPSGPPEPAEAVARVLRALEAAPLGLPTRALVDWLEAAGTAPSVALELIWRLRDEGTLAMDGDHLVLAR